jgi:hypothetical protein
MRDERFGIRDSLRRYNQLGRYNQEMDIRSGTIAALYLFDVAEQVDLARLRETLGGAAARLASKSAQPASLQYQVPPLVLEADAAGRAHIEGFHARLKFFDYGVVSLALVQPFSGTWDDLVAASQRYIENPGLEDAAEQAVRQTVDRCAAAMTRPRTSYLSEDYLILAVHELETPLDADALLAARGPQLAQMLRGETSPLSAQEQEEVLKNRLSYLSNDLVVPTWNAAFVYDTEPGAAAALELFEFTNSQLLEFRYYDALLDAELARIYPELQRTSWWHNLFGGGATRAANQVHSLFIDINEITDRTDNALKIVGDIYAARVLALAAARLGLARWRQSVEDKLETLDDIYRFAVEQVSISRGQFLEIAVVVILVFELILFFLGLMK